MQVYTQTNVMTIHFSRLHSINHEKLHNQHVSIHFVTCDFVYSHLTHIDISKIYIQYLIISALNKLNWQLWEFSLEGFNCTFNTSNCTCGNLV